MSRTLTSSPAPTLGAGTRKTWKDLPVVPRRIAIVLLILVVWQAYVSLFDVSRLLVASPLAVGHALVTGWAGGKLTGSTLVTMQVLLLGMAIGIVVATVLTALATWSRFADDVLSLATAMLNPLPSIAILPLAMLWFGINSTALVFVIANAVVWPLAVNVSTGFRTLNPTILAVSRNIGLRGARLVWEVFIPAALPHIISGLKTAWAYGWRTIIAAELVFGVAGGSGGLGFFINDARYFLRTPDVFAGLVTIALIGIVFDLIFTLVERKTVVRWGMKSR